MSLAAVVSWVAGGLAGGLVAYSALRLKRRGEERRLLRRLESSYARISGAGATSVFEADLSVGAALERLEDAIELVESSKAEAQEAVALLSEALDSSAGPVAIFDLSGESVYESRLARALFDRLEPGSGLRSKVKDLVSKALWSGEELKAEVSVSLPDAGGLTDSVTVRVRPLDNQTKRLGLLLALEAAGPLTEQLRLEEAAADAEEARSSTESAEQAQRPERESANAEEKSGEEGPALEARAGSGPVSPDAGLDDEAEPRLTDLVAVCEAVASQLAGQAEAESVRLSLFRPPSSAVPEPVLTFPSLLLESCKRLALQSVRDAPEGSVVEVGAARVGKEAWLWVADEVKDCSQEALEKSFSGGERGQPALSALKTAVEVCGGSLEVLALSGQGRRFTVRFGRESATTGQAPPA